MSEWISTLNEWPEPHKTVIVEGGVAYHDGKTWFTITGEEWPGKAIQWPVKYWMPMPEAPKEQS